MKATIQHHTTDSLSGEDVFAEVSNLGKSLIAESLTRMIESAEDYHSWSLSDQDGTRIIKLIKRKQRIICSSFLFQLNRHFASFKAGDSSPSTSQGLDDWQRLGLSAASGSIETEALKNIASRYVDVFHEFDRTILKRLQTCIRRSRASIYDNPLQVKKLCESFQYAISSLGLETNYKIALYHLFNDRFINSLGPVYRRIDHHLIARGMLPETPPAHINLRSFEGLSESCAPGNFKPDQSGSLLLLLQQFKEQSNLAASNYQNLFPQLKQTFGTADIHVYDAQIDHLSLMFELIGANKDLPSPVKQQLARLQIYIFMTAIQEDGFLHRSSNPARKLLDCITSHEVEIGKAGETVFSGIDYIRQEIDAMYPRGFVSVEHYAQMREGYQAFMVENETRVRKARKREATLKILPRIKARLAEITQPLRVQGTALILFEKVWLPLLVQIALRQGVDSDLWRKSIAMVRKQVWSMIPKSTPQEQQVLLQKLPAIAHSFHRAMRSLKLAEKQQRSLSELLQLEQQNVVEQTARNIIEAKRKTRSLGAQSFANDQDSSEFDAMMQTGIFQLPGDLLETIDARGSGAAGTINQVEALSAGDWVNMKHQGNKLLTKLAWKAEDSSLFIFVDRDGKRVCELNSEQLAKQFESGEVSLPGSCAGVDAQKTQSSFMKKI